MNTPVAEVAPVYLIASERSGTNLLRKLITQHQNVYFGPAPAHFLTHLYNTEPYYQSKPFMDESSFRILTQDALNLCYVHWSPWAISFDVDNVIASYKDIYDVYNSIYLSDYLMREYAKSLGYKSYFCKDNHLFDYPFEIKSLIPNAKFIYLYRDPRDYCLSQKKRTLQTDSVIKVAKLWRQEQEKSISALFHLGVNNMISLSYEDLISEPHLQIRRICDFLGVSFRDEASDTPVMHGSVVTKEWENLDKPIIKKNMKKYLAELSRKEIEAIEYIAFHQMKYLGYDVGKPKKPSLAYRLYDQFILDLYSILRRRYFQDSRDAWSVPRSELTAQIARRRRL